MENIIPKRYSKLILMVPILIGCGMAAVDVCEFERGRASVNWIAAKGKILSNSIKTERKSSGVMTFIPTVEYSYHIKDDAYRGYRLTFPDHLESSEKHLKDLLASIQVGRTITAYYDPKNTANVTLVKGIRRSRYITLFLRDAAIATLTPIAFIFLLWYHPKKANL